MIVGKKRGPANACALFAAFAVSGCVGVLGPDDDSKSERAGDVHTAAEYCDFACSRLLECDSSQNLWSCVHGCAYRLAAAGDVLRSDFVRDLSSCYANRDCASMLDGSAATECHELALGEQAPSQPARSFCEAHDRALALCGTRFDPQSCLEDASIFTDTALASALGCFAKPCVEIDACMATELGSAPVTPTPCDDPPPLCRDSSDIRLCMDGYYQVYDCSFICNGHGFNGGECGAGSCECGEPVNAACTQGAAAVCACLGCSEEEQRSIYVTCQLDTAPFVACYGAWAGEEGVDCASASEHCL